MKINVPNEKPLLQSHESRIRNSITIFVALFCLPLANMNM